MHAALDGEQQQHDKVSKNCETDGHRSDSHWRGGELTHQSMVVRPNFSMD
jgi:hypothetical protein